jgi:serine/threonine-protein kinase HipA
MRCLYCYQPLTQGEVDYHSSCSKKFFGQLVPPELPYAAWEMEQLATEVIRSQVSVTGVQPKFSLDLTAPERNQPKRFTIVGLWGDYILKPPYSLFPHTPEVEDLTMHLASLAKIKVVPHSLIRLKSGELAYITKRIDRDKKKNKIHMEDMCQLTDRQTEHKYRGSYEQIAKAIQAYSMLPGLDVINFYEQILISFLTGNADMHLKNFSILHDPESGPVLSPAYDLVATALVNPEDQEDLGLTLNGKKHKIRRSDFEAAFTAAKLTEAQQVNIFRKMEKARQSWLEFIAISFLNEDLKAKYINLINDRFKRLA